MIREALARAIRHQVEAAKAELVRRWLAVRPGVVLAAAGVVVILFGIGALIAAAIFGLAQVLPVWLSALLVGVVLVAVAAVLLGVGVRKLRQPSSGEAPQ